jgi:hypothetical protein
MVVLTDYPVATVAEASAILGILVDPPDGSGAAQCGELIDRKTAGQDSRVGEVEPSRKREAGTHSC